MARSTLTDPNGAAKSPRAVDEARRSDLVDQYLGPDAQPAGNVDLSDFGTGKLGGLHRHGRRRHGQGALQHRAVVVGPDQDNVVILAQELLTAEDAGNVDGG